MHRVTRPVDGRTARWAGHRDMRRAEIARAAVAVIDREGPLATVEQFAAELGLTRQVVYRQFDDRGDLDHEICAIAAHEVVDLLLPWLRLDPADGAPPGDDALATQVRTAVRGALAAYLGYVESHLSLYRFVRSREHELAGPQSSVRQVKDRVSQRVASLASTYLVGTGAAPPAATGLFAVGLVGLADAVISRWLDDPGDVSRDELLDTILVMVEGAIAGSWVLAAPQA